MLNFSVVSNDHTCFCPFKQLKLHNLLKNLSGLSTFKEKKQVLETHSLASYERCSSDAINVSSCVLLIFLECSYVAMV